LIASILLISGNIFILLLNAGIVFVKLLLIMINLINLAYRRNLNFSILGETNDYCIHGARMKDFTHKSYRRYIEAIKKEIHECDSF